MVSRSEDNAGEEETLTQWLNSGLPGGKTTKGQGQASKVIIVPDFVNGERIEKETTLTQWLGNGVWNNEKSPMRIY